MADGNAEKFVTMEIRADRLRECIRSIGTLTVRD